MKRPLYAPVIAGLAAAGMLLTACSGGGSDAKDQPAAEATKGGTAIMSLSADPGTLDPTIANTFAARVIFTTMCEKLYDANEELELVPQLAAELPEVSEDGLTVGIQLREGIKFNDGTPMDAEAVKTSLDRHRELPTSARKLELAAVDQVNVVDEHRVELKLNKPFSPLGAQLADRAGTIMSPTALEELGEDFGTDPVCVGPFSFKSQVAGSEMTFEKSDHYYDKDKVNLDKVVYQFVTDANVRAANLRSGDVQVAERVNASEVPQLESDPNLKVLTADTIAYQSISINMDAEKSKSPLTTSPELRKAFEMSIDRKALNDVVFGGSNVVDCIALPMQSTFRPDNVDCDTFDPKAAKQMVEDTGATTPVPVELMFPSNPPAQKTAEVVQQMAAEAGFKVTLKPVEFLTALDAGRSGDFEMFLIGWSGRIDPDGNFNDIVTTGGSNNFSHVSDTELDQLVGDAAAALDPSERKDLYGQVIDRIDELKPNIYLYHDTWFLGLNGIDGVVYSSDAIPRFKEAFLTK